MLAERQAAVEAILRAGHIPAGMELFAAGDQSQLDTIRRWIEDSDAFMLILGGRYGSVERKIGKSYIQLEYEYAIEKGKPLFAAVISEDYLTAKVKAAGPDAMERDNSHLLKTFRDTVTGKICRFFGDVNELKVIVFESLSNLAVNERLVGWVHGSDVIDPKATLEQVGRLQAENESLRNRLMELEGLLAEARSADDTNSTAADLSDDAKTLLFEASVGRGHILYRQFMGGAAIQTENRNFIHPQNDHRQEARWKAALEELEGRRLVEDVSGQGQTYRLTKRGYDVADEIKRQQEDGGKEG